MCLVESALLNLIMQFFPSRIAPISYWIQVAGNWISLYKSYLPLKDVGRILGVSVSHRHDWLFWLMLFLYDHAHEKEGIKIIII